MGLKFGSSTGVFMLGAYRLYYRDIGTILFGCVNLAHVVYRPPRSPLGTCIDISAEARSESEMTNRELEYVIIASLDSPT